MDISDLTNLLKNSSDNYWHNLRELLIQKNLNIEEVVLIDSVQLSDISELNIIVKLPNLVYEIITDEKGKKLLDWKIIRVDPTDRKVAQGFNLLKENKITSDCREQDKS